MFSPMNRATLDEKRKNVGFDNEVNSYIMINKDQKEIKKLIILKHSIIILPIKYKSIFDLKWLRKEIFSFLKEYPNFLWKVK